MKKLNKTTLVLGMASMLCFSCDGYLDIIPKGKAILTEVEQYTGMFNNSAMHGYHNGAFEGIIDDSWKNPVLSTSKEQFAGAMFFYKDPQTYDRLILCNTSSMAIYAACYARINKISNIILDNIGEAEGDDDIRKLTIAEARVFRAYNYFVLVNIFGKHYDPQTAATDLCVPLFDHYGLELRPAQATVAQLYQFIEEDINAAISDLAINPENCFHFSKAAGYALKAKVHLLKKEFTQAKEAALESYKLNNYVYDFKTISSLTTLVKMNHNPENLYYATPSSGVSNLAGLDMGAFSPAIADLFGATYASPNVKDTRFTMFLSYKTTKVGTATSTDETVRLDARLAPAYDVSLAGAKYFCYNGGGLRTTDVILILAECCAREGDYTNMNKYLDEVRTKRIIDHTATTLIPTSQTEAVNIVIDERRRELMGGFNRWCDLRRLNTETAFKRTLTRVFPANDKTNYPQETYTLPADSWLWVLPLPQDEFPLWGSGLTYNVPY